MKHKMTHVVSLLLLLSLSLGAAAKMDTLNLGCRVLLSYDSKVYKQRWWNYGFSLKGVKHPLFIKADADYVYNPGSKLKHTNEFEEGNEHELYYSQNSNYELSREQVTIGQIPFTIIKYLSENCGMNGKVSYYAFHCYADVVLNGVSHVVVTCSSEWGDEKTYDKKRAELTKLLQLFQNIHTPETESNYFASHGKWTADKQETYWKERMEKRAKALHKTSLRNAKPRKKPLDYYYYYSDWNAMGMGIETFRELQASEQYEQLADTIRKTYLRTQLPELARYMKHYRDFNYSYNHEYDIYKKMGTGKVSYTDYLNHINQQLEWNVLDTLEEHIKVNHFDLFKLLDFISPATIRYGDYLEKRFYFDFHTPFLKSFYKYTLHCADSSFYPYAHLLNDSVSDHYFMFNPEADKRSEILLTTFRKNTNTGLWQHSIDSLDGHIKYKGNDRLIPFNQYFVLRQRDGAYILDTAGTHTVCSPLPFLPDTLKHFIYNCRDVSFADSGAYVYPLLEQFQREKVAGDFVSDMFNKAIELKEFCIKKYQQKCKGCMDMGHGDTLIYPSFYYGYARSLLHASQMIYNVQYTVRDLNGDDNSELYSYCMSNGQVLALHCYTSDHSGWKKMDNTIALKWLEYDVDFMNLRSYSKIGRQKAALPPR
ncbi:MAG: hypothetical protein ACKVOR_11030 [Flavobacteriales bacterium]